MSFDTRHPDSIDALNVVFALARGDEGEFLSYVNDLGFEWFVDICQQHSIGGFAYEKVEALERVADLPASGRRRLRVSHLEQWAAAQKQAWELRELDDVMEVAERPYLLLKGLHLAHRFYGGGEQRAMGDIDILIRSLDFEHVTHCLDLAGYQSESALPFGTSRSLAHVYHVQYRRGEIPVEIHVALRVHPTLCFDDEAIWSDDGGFDFRGRRYRVLPDEYVLVLLLLEMHYDVSLGTSGLKKFLDVYRVLGQFDGTLGWDRFLENRRAEGARKICLNALALLLTLLRCENEFPELTEELCRHRDQIVETPQRQWYLQLLRQTSLRGRKEWPFRSYEGSLGRTAAWWVTGLPYRIAAHRKSFVRSATGQVAQKPWHLLEADSDTSPAASSVLRRDFNRDSATLQRRVVSFGAWRIRVYWERDFYLRTLRELFRLDLSIDSGHGEPVDAEVFLFDSDRRTLRRTPVSPQSVTERRLEEITEIYHQIASAHIHWRHEPRQILIPILGRNRPQPEVVHSLMVVFIRAMFWLEMVHLHAAAVRVGTVTSLFVGDNHSGKSTISLSLGLAGGEILGEDHVIVQPRHGRYVVSGCDGNMRVTRKTEEFFFQQPLPEASQQFGGVSKKEIRISDHLNSRPFANEPVGAIFFPAVGDRFEISPLDPQAAAVRLMRSVEERHRFADLEDRKRFVEFFSQLVGTAPPFDLQLSPNLADLEQLHQFLSTQQPSR